MNENEVAIGVIPVTDENKEDLGNLAISMYIGEKCICGHKFGNIEELKKTVWHPHEGGRISHKKCYEDTIYFSEENDS